MKRIISISKIVESREMMKGTRDVIAVADARFDEKRLELIVDCHGAVVMTDARGHESKLPVEWMPKPEMIHEHIFMDEAMPLARDIFESWATKVRASIPGCAETCKDGEGRVTTDLRVAAKSPLVPQVSVAA